MKVTGNAQDAEDTNVSRHNTTSGDTSQVNEQMFEEKMFSALDAVCRSSEQTYEQFMQGFLYLKPENVRSNHRPMEKNSGPPAEFLEFQKQMLARHRRFHPPGTMANVVEEQGACSSSDAVDLDKHVMKQDEKRYDPESLQEEVLEEGTRTKTFLMRSNEATKGVKIKVGNFLEDEDEVEQEENDNEGVYMPSFGNDPTSSVDAGAVTPQSNGQSDRTLKTPQSVKPADSRCSEEVPSVEQRKLHSETPAHPAECSQNDLLQHIAESANQLSLKEVQNVFSDRNKSDTILNPQSSDQSENLLDLIGDVDSDSDSDLVYNPALDKPNFGEVEDEIERKVTTGDDLEKMANKTELDFRVLAPPPKKSEDSEGICENEDMEESQQATASVEVTEETRNTGNTDEILQEESHIPESSTEVEAFSLDENFDYDNVVLTPKFNAQEMAYLEQFKK